MNYTITDKSITAVIDGSPYSITSDHPQFALIRDALMSQTKTPADIAGLFDQASAVASFMHNEVRNDGGAIFYKDEPVHGVVADRILEFMEKGLPYQPLVAFLKRLSENPSKHSVEELYPFIEKNKLPITEDGFVLGYKGVDEDFKDQYSHTINYRPGAKITRLKRNQVDDNWREQCSSGYHIGSREYAEGYGARTIIVKFDPADAISVPEGDAWKLRVCYFESVAEYQGELPKVVAKGDEPYAKDGAVKRFFKRLFGQKIT